MGKSGKRPIERTGPRARHQTEDAWGFLRLMRCYFATRVIENGNEPLGNLGFHLWHGHCDSLYGMNNQEHHDRYARLVERLNQDHKSLAPFVPGSLSKEQILATVFEPNPDFDAFIRQYGRLLLQR